jgi:hypothetical protein
MIAELTGQVLSPELWGNKAARLSQAARLGFTVPAAICFQAGALTSQQVGAALSSWLLCHHPSNLIIRTSSILEDTKSNANAGRTISIADCLPDAGAVMGTIQSVLLPCIDEWTTGNGTGFSVIVQEQVNPPLGGVAFLADRRMTVEMAVGSTSTVTSGGVPDLRVEVRDGAVAVAEGAHIGQIPIAQVSGALYRMCRAIQDSFGFDVDLEWAWLCGGVVILQVRPMTLQLEPRGVVRKWIN